MVTYLALCDRFVVATGPLPAMGRGTRHLAINVIFLLLVLTPSVWKFDALWEHPLGKGEATCHSSWLYSLCTEDTWKATTRVHDAMILQEVMEDW